MLKERLAHLSASEKQKLYKEAARLRKQNRGKASYVAPEADESGRIRMRQQESLDSWVLKVLDLEKEAILSRTPAETGQVVSVGPKTCIVRIEAKPCETEQLENSETQVEDVECLLEGFRVAAGDQVGIAKVGDVNLLATIVPRLTKLSRPDPDNANLERVIVANVDVVVIVVSVVAPPLHPRLIDRYLIAIQNGGAQPLICVNKVDLLSDPQTRSEELDKLVPYQKIGVQVVPCSSETKEGLDELRTALKGKLCAFVGHSGVGKSSLMNAMHPELGLATGAVSEGYGRGTHTTTASKLCDLGNGLRVIDTPGIRSFGLWDVSLDELRLFFPEFDDAGCKYRNCSHTHEPNCGVKPAVESGVISEARYDTYLRLLEGMED